MKPTTLTLITLTVAAIISQTSSAPNCDLSHIFKIPPKRKYDDLEILERSNFETEPTIAPRLQQTQPQAQENSRNSQPIEQQPRTIANAQILLKFSDAAPSSMQQSGVALPCGCIGQCSCASANNNAAAPQSYAYLIPISQNLFSAAVAPQCSCFNPQCQCQCLHNTNNQCNCADNTISNNINNSPQADNFVLEKPNSANLALDEELKSTRTHPEILKTVELSSPESEDRIELDQALLPYISDKIARNLVTYPIFNKAQALDKSIYEVIVPENKPRSIWGLIITKPQMSYTPYRYWATASGEIFCEKVTPAILNEPKKEEIIVNSNANNDNCYCRSCAKYIGELNELNSL